MTYQVLARKWRPQTFDAVVGQDAITRTLRNALAADRIAHAYLFAGPRGVGKTTTARLLARALLCPDRRGPEPCDACAVCQETRAGVSLDLFEIDAASNRKIEDVRALRENVKYAPTRGRYKVYIIDEAHQLTADAFDALLKTLEEPPAHVVFVLATTDPRELPATILSRVQRFDFRPIAPDALRASLEGILHEEKVPFDAAALPVIVRAAQGSLRDALSLVDTAIAYGQGRLDAETIATLLGTTASAEVHGFARAVLAHESGPALEAIDRAAREGEDLQAFARDVIELVRQTMVLKAAPTTQPADLTAAEANELRKLGESVSLEELLYVVRAFLDADELMRESPHPRVELEIATVRATRRPVPQALDDVLRRVDEAEARLRRDAPAAASGGAAQGSLLPPPVPPAPARSAAEPRGGASAPSRGRGAPGADASPRASGPAVADSPPRVEPPPRASDASSAPRPETSPASPGEAGDGRRADAGPDLTTAWQRVIDDVMKKKPTLGAVLMHARPGVIEQGELTVIVTGNHFHRDTLADRGNRELVLQAIRKNVPGVDRMALVAADAGGRGSGVTDDPLVQATLAEFQGEVVAVRPRLPEGDGP